jgi:DNA modification methylase
MFQDEVMAPMGAWAEKRLKNLSETDLVRDTSKVGSGFGKRVANWLERDKVYPTNVLHLAAETKNRNHSAAFPDALPEWFIKLFAEAGDTVLDPFMGSGTTIRVAKRLGRAAIGVEVLPEYFELAKQEIASAYRIESNDFGNSALFPFKFQVVSLEITEKEL